jgi:hypothetical protein
MIEDRPIDEPMNGSDIQPSPEAYVDPSSTDLKAVDVDVAENADQPTTTDAVWKETTAPPASPEAYVDPSSTGLKAVDVDVAENADQTTTTVSETETETETTAPAEQLYEPESTAPAPAADQPATPSQTNEERLTPLFAADSAKAFRSRWQDIQTSFVDEPGRAVENADSLVAEVMQQLSRTFAEERAKLEPQLVQGEEISTEDLRMAIRRYRSFFDRLLSI